MKTKAYFSILLLSIFSCSSSRHGVLSSSEKHLFPTIIELSNISQFITQLLDSSCCNQLNITDIKKVIKSGYPTPFYAVSLSSPDTSIRYPAIVLISNNFKFMSINPNNDINVNNGDTLRDSTEILLLQKKATDLIGLYQSIIEEPKCFYKNKDGYYASCYPKVIWDSTTPYPFVHTYFIDFNNSKCVVGFH